MWIRLSKSNLVRFMAAGGLLIIISLHASAQDDMASYPAFDKRCTESQIRQYLDELNRHRIDFVYLAFDTCKQEAVPILEKLRHSEDTDLRSLAAYGLAITNTNKQEAIALLIAALKDKNLSVRLRSIQALSHVVTKQSMADYVLVKNAEVKAPEGVVRGLTGVLKDKDKLARSRAAITLVKLKQDFPALIPVLLDALRSDEVWMRSGAAYALGEIGKGVPTVTPALIVALKDCDADVRANAAGALGNSGNNNERVVRALSTALRDESPHVRYSSVLALGQIGKGFPTVVSAMIVALGDKDDTVREEVLKVLGGFGPEAQPAIPGLFASLKMPAGDLEFFHNKVADTLSKIGPAAVPQLIAALKASDKEQRLVALDALAKLGQDAKDAVPVLIALLPDESIGESAGYTIGKIGYQAPEVIPLLIPALRDKNPLVRSHASLAYWGLSGKAKILIPDLIRALKHDVPGIRSDSAKMLGRIGPAAIPALIEALRNADVHTRAGSALAFHQMYIVSPYQEIRRDPAIISNAIPALKSALTDPHEVVRYRAILALKELDAENTSLPHLPKAALGDEDESVHLGAAVVLVGTDESLTKEIVTILIAALGKQKNRGSDPFVDRLVRAEAATYLARLAKDAQAAVPALIKATKDEDLLIRRSAAYALAACWKEKKSAVIIDALVSYLKNGDENDRKIAVEILERVGTDGIAALRFAFEDNDRKIRVSIVREMSWRGQDAISALPLLRAALRDNDREVRHWAVTYLAYVEFELKSAIPDLINALADADEENRYEIALLLRRIADDAVAELIQALRSENAYIRKGAAYALGNVKVIPSEAIESLKAIVSDQSQDLDVRRVAASTLEKAGQNMEPFFTANNLVAPRDAVCPGVPLKLGSAYFQFNSYSGRCMFSHRGGPLSGGFGLYDYIKRLFGGK
jgi:HEAT repeat protein